MFLINGVDIADSKYFVPFETEQIQLTMLLFSPTTITTIFTSGVRFTSGVVSVIEISNCWL